jgi:hypothetical protein
MDSINTGLATFILAFGGGDVHSVELEKLDIVYFRWMHY